MRCSECRSEGQRTCGPLPARTATAIGSVLFGTAYAIARLLYSRWFEHQVSDPGKVLVDAALASTLWYLWSVASRHSRHLPEPKYAYWIRVTVGLLAVTAAGAVVRMLA